MALNRYSKSSRFTPDTTGPDGERVADPSVYGQVSKGGDYKVSSWPDIRALYEKGELELEENETRSGMLKPYLSGDTNKLTERYEEPIILLNEKGEPSRNPLTQRINFGSNVRLTAKETEKLKKVAGQTYKKGQSPQYDIGGLDNGNINYQNFGIGGKSSVESIRQREKDPEIKAPIPSSPPPPTLEEKRKFDKEGPVRMPVTKATLDRPKSGKIDTVRPDSVGYSDPGRPSKIGKSPKGFKGDRIKNYKKSTPKIVQRFNRAADMSEYRKEGRLAKATYGRGLEGKSAEELQQRSEGLKERRREQASIFKREDGTSNKKREDGTKNKITGMNKLQLFKNIAVNKEARQEGRDINRAQKYREMVGGSDIRPLASQTESKKEGQPRWFKPAVMKNFRGSDDNPLNRNSSSKFFR